MKLSLAGLLRLQPFDQRGDPPKPAWIDSWWFGGLLLVAAVCGALSVLSLFGTESLYTFPLLATAGTLYLLAGVVEWFAELKARALNTFFIAFLCAVAIAGVWARAAH